MMDSETTSTIIKVATAGKNHRILLMQTTVTNVNITKQYGKITCFVNNEKSWIEIQK